MSARSIGWRAAIPGCLGVLLAALWAAPSGPARAAAQDLGTDAQRESGRRLYETYCAQCHGEKGDGEGDATPHLRVRARDFTTGKYKVRTTPSGALPTHQDLVNIIRRGMPYTSMPPWPNLSNQQLSDLAYHLKTFSPDFSSGGEAAEPVPLPSAPSTSEESVELGRKLYAETGCIQCHGTVGRGDGPSAPTLVDEAGHPIRAADLTQPWTFRGGSSREDIFRTMTTGFNGTPMPAFLDALTPEERWAITDFILSLSGNEGPAYSNLVIARRVEDPIDLEKGAANFESAPVARFPIVGQIVEPGRSFHPLTTSVTVQAVYDAESIAVLVRWHDMRAERTGRNGPALPVPLEEELETRESAPAAAEDVWGLGEAAAAAPQIQPDPVDIWGDEPVADPAAASEFSDAVAVQIPTRVPTDARKPYFIFGDAQYPVDLWFFDLAGSEPLQFTGRGSADIAPNDTGDVTGVASYDQGEWSVIFTRPLRPTSGAAFSPGEFMPVAFSVWDGFSRERGNRRGLTSWYSLYIEPEEVPSAIGPMVRVASIILLMELAVIGWVRRRYRPRPEEIGGQPGQHAATSA
jgi:mono/diheme cytochrome c family protein